MTTDTVLKFEQPVGMILQCSNVSQNAHRMNNSADPDQTAPEGAV